MSRHLFEATLWGCEEQQTAPLKGSHFSLGWQIEVLMCCGAQLSLELASAILERLTLEAILQFYPLSHAG